MSLIKIQAELKAPKNQRNAFGNYNFRSCEDIVEAVKPLLAKYNTALLMSDEIVLIGDRYYVKATISLVGDVEASTSAYAREDLTIVKQGVAQVTGGASSYARKYALNGLFAIDDSKDVDTQDNSKPTAKKPMTLNEYLKTKRVKDIKGFALKHGIKSTEDAEKILSDKKELDDLIDDFLNTPTTRLP